MNALEAAEQTLEQAETPLHIDEITERMIKNGLWASSGKTPSATVGAALYTDIKDNGINSRFEQVAPSTFSLRNFAENTQNDISPPLPSVNPSRHTWINGAQQVLAEFSQGQPMHYRDITQKALDKRWCTTEGKTPENSMYAAISSEIKRRQSLGEHPLFVKRGRGLFSLYQQSDQGLAIQIDQHNEQIRKDLRNGLLTMQPEEFEELITLLLAEMGFEEIEVTRHSHDSGIDVRGTMVIGDVIRIKMAIQAKRWGLRNNIQKPIVQQVRGSLGAHEQGLIITTSAFSQGALREAEQKDKNPIALVNGKQLVALLMEHGIGVRRTTSNVFELDSAFVKDKMQPSVN